MVKLLLQCFLIESAEKFINLLSTPIFSYNELKQKKDLYSNWIQYFLNLYNDRTNFLTLARTKMNGGKNSDLNILDKTYQKNYDDMKENFNKIKDLDSNTKLRINFDIFTNDNENENDNDIGINDLNDNFSKNKYQNDIIKNRNNIEYGVFRMIVFVFKYLHTFEDKSININLWNYCLKSMNFSNKNFFIGIFTLICQYTWTCALIYNLFIDFKVTTEPVIIVITIVTTIISILYSYETFCSFWHSIPLYYFLLKLHDENPNMELTNDEKNYYFFKSRNIAIKKNHIRYNLCADFLSNFILPLIIPILNIFITINSESIVDAILNSMAIFFIIQVDEELYRVTEYARDQECIIFTRWIISCIYCKYFPLYEKIYRKECENWQDNAINLSVKYKRKISNKIHPLKEVSSNNTNIIQEVISANRRLSFVEEIN
jgi:hypothetical protein